MPYDQGRFPGAPTHPLARPGWNAGRHRSPAAEPLPAVSAPHRLTELESTPSARLRPAVEAPPL